MDIVDRGDYEEWVLGEGEAVVHELGDGGVLSDVLINQTAPDANFYVTAVGNPTDWSIENVGWEGVGTVEDTGGYGGEFHMIVSGDGVIENVYIDNREPEGTRGTTWIGGALTPQHHSGHIDVRGTFIAGCGNNAFYASNSAKDGGGMGTVAFDGCYHRDNTVSQFRIGAPGSTVRNSIGIVNDPTGRRGLYPNQTEDSYKNARLVWGRHCDDLVVEDCSFYQSPDDIRPDGAFASSHLGSRSNCPSNELIVRNFDINSDIDETRNGISESREGGTVTIGEHGFEPTVDVLSQGVPMSAEMAARGYSVIPDIPELSINGTMEYDTITLDPGEYHVFDQLGDGDTFENVLIDCRAAGAAFKQNADGDGWTIRNVGVLGVPERVGHSEEGDHLFNLAGNGIIENCFVDARVSDTNDTRTRMGFFRAKRSHDGHIEMRNCFCAGSGNNASYASSAGKNNGGGGSWVYDSCYHRDCTPSLFRPGTEGSAVINSVGMVDDPDCLRGVYPGGGGTGSRIVWVKHYPNQTVENCSFYINPDDCNPNQEVIEARYFEKSDGPGVEVDVIDVGVHPDTPNWPNFNERNEVDYGYARINEENVHDDPTMDVIEGGGVPLSAEMAAGGLREMPDTEEIPLVGGGSGLSDIIDLDGENEITFSR